MHALDVQDNSTQPFGSPLDESRRLLDSYAAGGADAGELTTGLIAACSADPDASWPVLAWLDQYHRRGILATDLFRDLKERIERLAVPQQSTVSKAAFEPGITELHDADSEPLPPAPADQGSPQEPAIPQAKTGCAPGSVLRDRYELVDELGRGGMGTVYRARDRERRGLAGLAEFVAIKVLRDDWLARPDALAALREECFRAQSLSHPNIVNVYDWDRDGDTCFVTMELVDGEPLSRILERVRPGKLRHAHALAILDAVGQALVYAHANGVVHADLKPGNVMIGHDGRVRVLDFGLARPVLREPSVDGAGGVALMRAATPAYASPEVLRGINAVPRDDVFSFGCLAYELLGGTAPFERQSVKEARRGRPMPPRPAGCTGGEWRAIRKALAPQREDRPASVAVLLDQLGDDDTPRVPPLKALIDGARVPRRRANRWLVATLVLVAVAALGFFLADRYPTLPALIGAGSAPGQPMDRPGDPSPAARDSGAPESVAAGSQEPGEARLDEPEVVIERVAPASVPDANDVIATDVEPASDRAIDEADEITAEPVASAAAPVATLPAGPVRVDLQPATVTVSESGGVARLRVSRRGSLARPLDVRWWTEPAEAAADEDYAEFGQRTERLNAGQASASILIPIVADAVHESTETFTVAIAVDGDEAALGNVRSTVIVIDDD